MITIQWVVYMVVVCCALFGILFLLYSFMAKQTAKHEEDEVDASPMTLAHDRDWSEAISQKEIPYTSDDPDFLSTNRSTVPKKSKPKSAGSTPTEHLDKINVITHEVMKNPKKCAFDDKYQKYAEEELEKNTKQMESFKGEDAEVIPENKKLTKDERLALIKESAKKKSVGDSET